MSLTLILSYACSESSRAFIDLSMAYVVGLSILLHTAFSLWHHIHMPKLDDYFYIINFPFFSYGQRRFTPIDLSSWQAAWYLKLSHRALDPICHSVEWMTCFYDGRSQLLTVQKGTSLRLSWASPTKPVALSTVPPPIARLLKQPIVVTKGQTGPFPTSPFFHFCCVSDSPPQTPSHSPGIMSLYPTRTLSLSRCR